MSTQTICDGCGKTNATETRGIVMPGDYCVDCARVVDQYRQRCDDLHSSVAETFALGLESITEEFAENHPDMSFPDA